MSLLPVDEAVARILAGVVPLAAETVPLSDADGRTLAAPLAARRDQPPFPASAMDGYAVRAADATVGARLRVTGIAAAGHAFAGSVGPGEAVRIFTGAPVPAGADAILIQEDADAAEGHVVSRDTPVAGQHVRPRGFDFAAGATLLEPGRVLGMREVALAAAMGAATVPVRRRPVVAMLATGDELVPVGALPAADQIFASNGFGLAAFVRAAGGVALDLGIALDRLPDIEAAVEGAIAAPADVLVTLGGASVGDHDLVQAALKARGMALDFWRVAMRPGKPLMFGRIGAMRVLGLPGNPVSSLVGAILFLRPLLAALLGQGQADPSVPAVAGAAVPANDTVRQDYLRAVSTLDATGRTVVTPRGKQDSSALATLAAADCLLIRPPR
ncbi:MAG TPA: molybdopterin molybdotransferase MoeA, partial [Bauldia sp.]|nr:molybdopterin molybdotransferase MoeA [Bauldia sp.]